MSEFDPRSNWRSYQTFQAGSDMHIVFTAFLKGFTSGCFLKACRLEITIIKSYETGLAAYASKASGIDSSYFRCTMQFNNCWFSLPKEQIACYCLFDYENIMTKLLLKPYSAGFFFNNTVSKIVERKSRLFPAFPLADSIKRQ